MGVRDRILDAADLPEQVIDVPEWGGEIKLRAMGWRLLREFGKAAQGLEEDESALAALMVAFSVVEEETDDLAFSREDVEALAAKNLKTVRRVANDVMVLNGWDGESEKKDSSETPSDEASSPLPNDSV